MKLILKNIFDEFIKSITFKDFEPLKNIFEELNTLEQPATAILFTDNEKISSLELSKFNHELKKLNIKFINIYSNSRETVLSAKSLKINSILTNKKCPENELFVNTSLKQQDTLHKGTVRSGNRISSNGDLFIMGDVNPGAIVSAKRNVYVWGKLLGIALAGEDGDKNASIASLYLNPLQLRICDIVAVGPKEKPKYQYPEVAILEEETIIIKPYLIAI